MNADEPSPWDDSDAEEDIRLPVIMVTEEGQCSYIRVKDSGWVASAYGASTPTISALEDPLDASSKSLDVGSILNDVVEELRLPETPLKIKKDTLQVPEEKFSIHFETAREGQLLRRSADSIERYLQFEPPRPAYPTEVITPPAGIKTTPAKNSLQYSVEKEYVDPLSPPITSPPSVLRSPRVRTSQSLQSYRERELRKTESNTSNLSELRIARPAPGAALHCVRRQRVRNSELSPLPSRDVASYVAPQQAPSLSPKSSNAATTTSGSSTTRGTTKPLAKHMFSRGSSKNRESFSKRLF